MARLIVYEGINTHQKHTNKRQCLGYSQLNLAGFKCCLSVLLGEDNWKLTRYCMEDIYRVRISITGEGKEKACKILSGDYKSDFPTRLYDDGYNRKVHQSETCEEKKCCYRSHLHRTFPIVVVRLCVIERVCTKCPHQYGGWPVGTIQNPTQSRSSTV